MQPDDQLDSAAIIGFMPDIKFQTFHKAVDPMAFYVMGTEEASPSLRFAYIKVKAGTDLRAAFGQVQQVLKSFDPDYAFNLRFYDTILNQVYQKDDNLGQMIALFSLMAVLISIAGVFGLVVFDGEYRNRPELAGSQHEPHRQHQRELRIKNGEWRMQGYQVLA
ncbi:MAG: hypothetical protein LBL81_02695 [Tannerella sp.]|jgi:putative ABC transport system permease protein|nr:hypothetical protein [Tannerella sp.]